MKNKDRRGAERFPIECLRPEGTEAFPVNFRVVAQRAVRSIPKPGTDHFQRFTMNRLEFQSSKNEGKAMKKQARNHVRKPSESDGAPAKPTSAVSGEFVTEMFEYDRGRQVTVYVPPDPP